MPRFFRRFRGRRRFRKLRMMRKPTITRLVDIGSPLGIQIAATSIDNYQLVVADDTPDPTVVSNDTTVAEVEEDSVCVGGRLTLYLNAASTGDAQRSVDICLYRDYRSQITDPTAGTVSDTIFTGPATLSNQNFRRNVMMFRKVFFTANRDKAIIPLRLNPKKGFIPQGTRIKLVVDNTSNQAVNVTLVGKMKFRHP